MSGDSVRVAVRVRPFNHRESDRNARCIITTNGPQTTITNPETGACERASRRLLLRRRACRRRRAAACLPPAACRPPARPAARRSTEPLTLAAPRAEETRTFTFDYSYWSHDEFEEEDDGLFVPVSEKYADQRRIFDDLGAAVLTNANKGINCSVLAYGQTGAGKSYTMMGQGANRGLLVNICDALFKQIDTNTDPKLEFQVRVSMLEVYNEKVRDLLNKRSAVGGLKVRQHPKLGVQIVGLTDVAVGTFEDVDRRIEEGITNRAIATTQMNAVSSRGHTVATISLTKIEKDAKGPGKHREQISKISMVDLAGCERADGMDPAGDRLREGSAINLSLAMLSNVITALAEKAMHPKKKIVVPYKESRLTSILQDALGGNSKTIFLAAVSPADVDYEETLEALRYADRAKRVKNKAVVNVDPTELLTNQLKEENKKLMEQLQAMMKDGTLPSEPTNEDGSPISEEEREEMRRQLQSEMAEQLAENQRMVEECGRPWEERVAESDMRFAEANREQRERSEKVTKTPHLTNLNEDPQLSGMVTYFLDGEPGETGEIPITVGTSEAEPQPTIVLGGLAVVRDHSVIYVNPAENIATIMAKPGARVLVNGKALAAGEKRQIHHHDTILFGAAQLYAFIFPQEARRNGIADPTPTYELGQDLIMTEQGYGTSTATLDIMTEAEKMKFMTHEDLITVLPLVSEANMMAEELRKHVAFDVKLVSRLKNGIFHAEVVVEMKHKLAETQWIWSKEKFVNRTYIMREIYDLYVQGGADFPPELAEDEDPFWDPPEPVLVGVANVYLSSLSYMIEFEDAVDVCDYKGRVEGVLQVHIQPCNVDGSLPSEDDDMFVEDPADLLGARVDVIVSIVRGRGFDPKYSNGIFCKFDFYGNPGESTMVQGTSDPEFDFRQQVRAGVSGDRLGPAAVLI